MRTIKKMLLLVFILVCTNVYPEFVFEEFFSFLTMDDKTGSSFQPDEFDLYFDNMGWTGKEIAKGDATTNVNHPNYVNKPRVGYWSGEAYLTSPTINMSEGVTVLLNLKAYARQLNAELMDYDKSLLLHAPDGENFTIVDTIKGMNVNFQEYSIPITDGTPNSKIRISRVHPSENAPNRFFVGSVRVKKGISVNVEGFKKEKELSVYPNPVVSSLFIDSFRLVKSVTVYNMLGQVVHTLTGNVKYIDMSMLSSGLYFVELNFEDGYKEQQRIQKK